MSIKFVTPKVFRVGFTHIDFQGVQDYLAYTRQGEFAQDLDEAMADGVASAEALCSLFAKLCYKSIVLGANANVKKLRSIRKNVEGTIDSGHGSVFEHASMNFLITGCSRVFTHELVRHRVGTAYSQTSGRYCRPVDNDGVPDVEFVHDPILDPVKDIVEVALVQLAYFYRLMEIEMGLLEKPVADLMLKKANDFKNQVEGGTRTATNAEMADVVQVLMLLKDYKESTMPFDHKKKLTSAMRRILPNGQSNEIAASLNVRVLRHCVMLRTQRFAEWEIRQVFWQIYRLAKEKFPTVFYDAKESAPIDGVPEIYGMKMQPYDLQLSGLPPMDLLEEIRRREYKFASNEAEASFREASNRLVELMPAA